MSNSSQFELFGPIHLATLATIFAFSAVLVILARSKSTRYLIPKISIFLAVVIILNELIFFTFLIFSGSWNYRWHLPLHLCDLAIISVFISLIWRKQWVWELSYYWALGGTIQALLTPGIISNFPEYIFFKFYLTHGLIVISVIFLAAGCGLKIEWASLKRVFIITNLYALIVGVFNAIFATNYGYLRAKPSHPSLLDHLGPWPQYLIGMEVVLIITLFLFYLPFYLVEEVED